MFEDLEDDEFLDDEFLDDDSPDEEGGNRNFLVIAGVLGGITVIAFLCLGGIFLCCGRLWLLDFGVRFDLSLTAFASSRFICPLTRTTNSSLTSMPCSSNASTIRFGVACNPSRISAFLIAF